MTTTAIVVDTSVVYAVAAAYEIEEIRALAPAEIVIPYSVIAELDLLMQRTRERDRARRALNVIKSLVDRGAAERPVTCGASLTLRVASAQEEHAQEGFPGLDSNLADDRILGCAHTLAGRGADVTLATTEFALYVKSVSSGIRGLYLNRFSDTTTQATRRERSALDLAWSRLQAAQDTWALCRRALTFLETPVLARLLQRVRNDREPFQVYEIIAKFDALKARWNEITGVNAILNDTLGLAPSPSANYSTSIIHAPRVFGIPMIEAASRYETPEERTLRIKAEEEAARRHEEYIVDVVLSWMDTVREYVLEQIGDEA